MYFSIQPNKGQGDEQVMEFPLSEPILGADTPLPYLLPQKALSSVNLWFGRIGVDRADRADGGEAGNGTTGDENDACAAIHTHLHNDPDDNFYVLIRGVKHFRVWPPSDALSLHTVTPPSHVRKDGRVEWAPREKNFKGYRFSHYPGLDHDSPGYGAKLGQRWDADDAKMGLEAPSSAALNVTLMPGDLMYLPRGWFHEVDTTCDADGSISAAVNHWFRPDLALRLL